MDKKGMYCQTAKKFIPIAILKRMYKIGHAHTDEEYDTYS